MHELSPTVAFAMPRLEIVDKGLLCQSTRSGGDCDKPPLGQLLSNIAVSRECFTTSLFVVKYASVRMPTDCTVSMWTNCQWKRAISVWSKDVERNLHVGLSLDVSKRSRVAILFYRRIEFRSCDEAF